MEHEEVDAIRLLASCRAGGSRGDCDYMMRVSIWGGRISRHRNRNRSGGDRDRVPATCSMGDRDIGSLHHDGTIRHHSYGLHWPARVGCIGR